MRSDLQRLLGLPHREVLLSESRAAALSEDLRTEHGTMTLRPIQAAALDELRQVGGLLGPIGVGHGKSLIALLAGSVLPGIKHTVVLTPASTVKQLRQTAIEMAEHWQLPPVSIYSYAALSQAKNSDLLPRLRRQHGQLLIVADEAHRLKARTSARTMRVIRFFQQHPGTRFVALSGTMTSKSIMDYSHLAELALRGGSPLPLDSSLLEFWSEVMDVGGRPSIHIWRWLDGLWKKYRQDSYRDHVGAQRVAIMRDVFRQHLWATPGVIATTGSSVDIPLHLRMLADVQLPEELHKVIYAVQESGETPEGEVIEEDAALWRIQRQLAQGFYYRWDWGDREPDREWLEARAGWSRYVRAQLEHRAAEGYDSPLLVRQRIVAETAKGARQGIHRAWMRWDAQRHKPQPPTVAVWVSDYLLHYIAGWIAAQPGPTIIWYDSTAIGDLLASEGLPVYGPGVEPPREAHDCAMSIQAHGVGKNLQGWSTQLVISPPSGGQVWEQMLGRTHRQGQEATMVSCDVLVHAPIFAAAIGQATKDAAYIATSTGVGQKLLYAVRE